MESYLLALLEANPERHMAKGVVFNGSEAVLFEARKMLEGLRLYESHKLCLGAGKGVGRRAPICSCFRKRRGSDFLPVICPPSHLLQGVRVRSKPGVTFGDSISAPELPAPPTATPALKSTMGGRHPSCSWSSTAGGPRGCS